MTSGQGTLTVGVVVVDDQLVFREAAREVIAAVSGFELLGEAASGEHGLAVVEELQPDLVLLDVRMPGMDGIETAARIHERHPEIVVVLISIEQAPYLPGAVTSCGAVAVLEKANFAPAALRDVWTRHAPPGLR